MIIAIGGFETEGRAQEVLMEIAECYKYCNGTNVADIVQELIITAPPKVYYVPEK